MKSLSPITTQGSRRYHAARGAAGNGSSLVAACRRARLRECEVFATTNREAEDSKHSTVRPCNLHGELGSRRALMPMPNRLKNETSPYLLQHADNPVDWHPWNTEALETAKREDKPILLSIGYAACHWCHVMAHESFEDQETARLMNSRFVNIKVDREERPDLDGIYMQALQAMTGHGGWPMTVFLTPDAVPFYAGTYFPPDERHGMPSFRRVLTSVADAYVNRRSDIARTAEQLREFFASTTHPTRRTGELTATLLERAYRGLAQSYDDAHGGFGRAPKFPQAMSLDFILRHGVRTRTPFAVQIVQRSFRAMARGGIYDQIGGGFARYAVDDAWQVPHFEKMLYDNALLARLGVHLWQATKDPEVRRVTQETIDWVLREMTGADGGFYSSLDADSEGEEGKFYIWTADEIRELLGGEAALASEYWGVTESGNFEGRNILNVPNDPAMIAARHHMSSDELRARIAAAAHALLAARAERVRPGRDDKVLAAWNGLMVRTLAEAARAFDRTSYREAAVKHGEFLFRVLVRDNRVLRSYKDGAARIAGYLEDSASLALAALALYELTFDTAWLARSRALAEATIHWFWDDDTGAFFDTASDHEQLVTRPRDVTDNATPSGTSLVAELLARLAELQHNEDLRRRATYVLETVAEPMARHPAAFGHALSATDLLVRGAIELAIVGDPHSEDFRALARAAAERYVPALVMAGGPARHPADVALLADRTTANGRAAAYVCRNYACDAPVTDAAELGAQLDAAIVA